MTPARSAFPVDVGEPHLLRDLLVAAAIGLALGLPLAAFLARLDHPPWGETLTSFAVVLVVLLVLGLVMRLALHAGYWYVFVHDRREGTSAPGRNIVLRYTRVPIMVGAACGVAALVLTLTGAA